MDPIVADTLDASDNKLARDAYKDGLTDPEMRLYLELYPEMASTVASSCPEHRTIALGIDGMGLKNCPKKEQTLEQVEAAIRQDGYALKHASKIILRNNPWLYAVAVKSNGIALRDVPEEYRYEGIYEDAVTSNGRSLWMVPPEKVTYSICLLAVRSLGEALQYVPEPLIDEEMAYAAVSNGGWLGNVPQALRTKDVCWAAVKHKPSSITLVPSKLRTKELITTAVELDWHAIREVARPSRKLLMIAFDQSPLAIEYFPEKWKTPDICRSAFERDATSIIFFPPDCASPSMVEGWLEHLTNPEVRRWQVRSRRNIEFLRGIDVEWLRLRRIGALLRELGLRRTLSAAWSPGDEAFHVLESISSEDADAISYYQDLPAPTIELESQPKDLDELTELLDGDLSDVDFGSYQFADYDPTRHDLSSAHVSVATLKRIGAYDDSSFMRLVGDVPEFAMMGPSKDGEIVPAVRHRELVSLDGLEAGAPCYYVSDIHLNHKLAAKFPHEASELEIREYLEGYAAEMVSDVPAEDRGGSTLLILGDTSYNLEVADIFFAGLKKCWGHNIVVVLGNHELWDYGRRNGSSRPTPTIPDVVRRYREMLDEHGITLVQNEILVRYRGLRNVLIGHDELERLGDDELARVLARSSLVILGGIGFSGLSEDFNATSGIYRDVVTSIEEDRRQAQAMSALHERVRGVAPKANVIVATHMPLRNWSQEPMQPGWVYVSGHTHRNTFTEENGIRAYEDNQVGYGGTSARLMRFFIERQYDPFRDLDDGIHEVERMDYRDFNRTRGIPIGSFTREGRILMLKREGVYLFLFGWETTGDLYLLSGGRINKLDVQDPRYYYENMVAYSTMVKEAFSGYQRAIRLVGDEVKRVGGWGSVHGCIVDIDFFNHVYLDPFTGKLTYYRAESVNNRVEYRDIRALLRADRQDLLPGLKSLPKGKAPDGSKASILLRGGETTLAESIIATDTLMYKPSRIMLSIQYLFDANVIRNWNEDALGIKRSQGRGSLPEAPRNSSSKQAKYLPERTGHRGRPSMRVPILQWRKNHPNGKMRECAADLGISLGTVKRHWDNTSSDS